MQVNGVYEGYRWYDEKGVTAESWMVGTGTRTGYVDSSPRDPRLQKNVTLKS